MNECPLGGGPGETRLPRRRYLLLSLSLLLSALVVLAAGAAPTPAAMPDWLEPRGLSLVELVGAIPDEYLQGTILSWSDWAGLVVYQAGSRRGEMVVITTTIYPRFMTVAGVPNNQMTLFGCLGQPPRFDHLASAVPTSTLRVFDVTGAEVTQQIWWLDITRMGTGRPIANSTQPFRYPEDHYGVGQPLPLPLGPDGLTLPPNSGCWIKLPGGDYYPLTGVFTLHFPRAVRASVPGTQQATFQSYIGVGWLGIFQPLMDQLRATYPDRHGRILLNIPPGANYFLLKYPPMPGDPYTDSSGKPPYLNADRLSSGTYRLARDTALLSGDLHFSAAFPLEVAWRDADQAPNSEFLPQLRNPTQLAPPEYVIPAGIPYDNCFTQGNCPDGLLQRIYEAEMELEIVYLQVIRSTGEGQWVPVKMAGPAWQPSAASGPTTVTGGTLRPSVVPTGTYSIFLPFVIMEGEEPTGCPCGWFDDLGRLLDFYPGTVR